MMNFRTLISGGVASLVLSGCALLLGGIEDDDAHIDKIEPSTVCTNKGEYEFGEAFTIHGKNFGDGGGEIDGVLASIEKWRPSRIDAVINHYQDPGTYELEVCPADDSFCSDEKEFQVKNGC